MCLNTQFIHEWNTAVFALEMRSGSAVTLFGTIFLDEMAQNQTIVLYSDHVSHLIFNFCLLNSCIKSISHLQTPLIISKSCHSQFIVICELTENSQ